MQVFLFLLFNVFNNRFHFYFLLCSNYRGIRLDKFF
ncbi:hypothetical protein BCEN4_740142 [Burkholderia cenocepacia]|nr:hypothetical protein BCEN4_740142 [Burkholderia cenocepacia]